jgi:hypothetical protein
MESWSKLKRNVTALFAESVRKRVGIYSTRYRTMHDHDGRAWITLDGQEIISMTHIWQWLYESEKKAGLLKSDGSVVTSEEYNDRIKSAMKELQDQSFFTQSHLGQAMFKYQSMPITKIMQSSNPIIRALGMLDRRMTLRQLKQINVSIEHPLVKALHRFRCEAEILMKQSVSSEKTA